MQLTAESENRSEMICGGHRRPVIDKSHIRLTYVTHFYLNQNDVSSLTDLLTRYENYSPDLLDRLQFVIVDDGSPLRYDIPQLNLNITWLKITEDIPWNQPGARNLGVTYAPSDKVLITDLDHEFPEETLRHMVLRGECGRNFYRVYRLGNKTRPHPNIFLLSRARFMRFYGYDEEFSGHYGSDDYRFVKIQKYHGTRFLKLRKKYRCMMRNDIDYKNSYHSLERDLRHNTPIDARKKQETLTYGPDAGHSRMFLNFSWKILLSNHRAGKVVRKKRPFWKHFWYCRWLFGFR
jgi:hypothetical protein